MLAAWVVPGGGHFLLKKTGRGALILASVGLMFLFGMFMRGMMFTPEKGDILMCQARARRFRAAGAIRHQSLG